MLFRRSDKTVLIPTHYGTSSITIGPFHPIAKPCDLGHPEAARWRLLLDERIDSRFESYPLTEGS